MLPGMVKPGGKKKRAVSIGKILKESDYDVIVFQEAFQRKARKRIFNQLKESFPYQAGPANRKFISYRTNSGLWIFSKHPIASSQSIIFQNRSGIDALSRKGGLLIEIVLNNKTHIQIAATHLQNSGPAWVRQSQCVEFYNRLLKPFKKEDVPQIVCGDFNISRKAEEYLFMLQTLQAKDGDLDSEQKFTYDRGQNDLHVESGSQAVLIDYILIRDQGNQIISTAREVRVFRDPWNKSHLDLSDHFALEAEIRFLYPTYFSKAKQETSISTK